MSYSFTDGEEPDILQQTMMVPFVDLLNHHSHHHAELNFQEEYLELVAVRDIGRVGIISAGFNFSSSRRKDGCVLFPSFSFTLLQDEEVMNTYGPLSNASLLHTYGFTEPGNPHDVVGRLHGCLATLVICLIPEVSWKQTNLLNIYPLNNFH